MTQVVHGRADFHAAREQLDGPLGLVMTMGALHEGHTELMRVAKQLSQSVITTIFVNPMQFAAGEDLGTYPRTLDDDVLRCKDAGVDIVWAPTVQDVYPSGSVQVSVDPGPLGRELEGLARPTHFAGVLTVVAKFFGMVRPAVAFFGEKDYQQLTLVRQMSADLELGVGIAGVPTVREPDGLARSSRNARLSPEDRRRAIVVPQALSHAAASVAWGPEAMMAAGHSVLAREPQVKVDYFELRGEDLRQAPEQGPARLLIAARIGSTRLIDNLAVTLT